MSRFKTRNSYLRALALFCMMATTAHAGESSVVIRYNVTLAGLPIGTAILTAISADNHVYRLNATGSVSGIASLISSGNGTAAATGRIDASGILPLTYTFNMATGKKSQTVAMTLANRTIGSLAVNPEQPVRADRIPVTAADRTGIIDPLSAVLFPGAMNPRACARKIPVFDGGQRFDIVTSYLRTDQVKAKGYAGPALVCSVRYIPIAGHRAGRKQTIMMQNNRDMELWLTPVEGTHFLVPWRIVVGTRIGHVVVEAARYGQSPGGSQ